MTLIKTICRLGSPNSMKNPSQAQTVSYQFHVFWGKILRIFVEKMKEAALLWHVFPLQFDCQRVSNRGRTYIHDRCAERGADHLSTALASTGYRPNEKEGAWFSSGSTLAWNFGSSESSSFTHLPAAASLICEVTPWRVWGIALYLDTTRQCVTCIVMDVNF